MTIVSVALNGAFSSAILAPSIIKSSTCEARDDLFTIERMNELLPLEAGQIHQQILCKQTNMLTTSFHTTTLRKVWMMENANLWVTLDYYSDENGNQRAYISSEPFVYLLAPFLFALCLSTWGQTPGKRLLGLIVSSEDVGRPSLPSALKREIFKGSIFLILALLQVYTMFTANSLDLEEAAKLVQSMSAELEHFSFGDMLTFDLVLCLAGLWLLFGSFIIWRGQTYWDRFANLKTDLY
ncbi:MAG: RDD family protein [Hyphomicrobiales bacterium]|uniref:RDD family protein n=1 Tax=Nisaea sp. TaxID=2024842 RepID=UPI0032681570